MATIGVYLVLMTDRNAKIINEMQAIRLAIVSTGLLFL